MERSHSPIQLASVMEENGDMLATEWNGVQQGGEGRCIARGVTDCWQRRLTADSMEGAIGAGLGEHHRGSPIPLDDWAGRAMCRRCWH